jgi:hypothetical protein
MEAVGGIEAIQGLDNNSGGPPQRLKPEIIARRSGTAEAVPFHNSVVMTLSAFCEAVPRYGVF